MEKKYIMIIEKDAVISTELPKPLECPRCNKPYWVIWGAGDVATVSNECKCKDQMPKVEKGIKELKQQGKDIINAEPTEPPAEPTEPPAEPTEPPAEPTEPPAEPTEPPAEPKKDVW